MSPGLDQIHARVRHNRWLKIFTVITRILLALAFLPSGITKVMGNRFTVLGIDNPLGSSSRHSIVAVSTGGFSAFANSQSPYFF